MRTEDGESFKGYVEKFILDNINISLTLSSANGENTDEFTAEIVDQLTAGLEQDKVILLQQYLAGLTPEQDAYSSKLLQILDNVKREKTRIARDVSYTNLGNASGGGGGGGGGGSFNNIQLAGAEETKEEAQEDSKFDAIRFETTPLYRLLQLKCQNSEKPKVIALLNKLITSLFPWIDTSAESDKSLQEQLQDIWQNKLSGHLAQNTNALKMQQYTKDNLTSISYAIFANILHARAKRTWGQYFKFKLKGSTSDLLHDELRNKLQIDKPSEFPETALQFTDAISFFEKFHDVTLHSTMATHSAVLDDSTSTDRQTVFIDKYEQIFKFLDSALTKIALEHLPSGLPAKTEVEVEDDDPIGPHQQCITDMLKCEFYTQEAMIEIAMNTLEVESEVEDEDEDEDDTALNDKMKDHFKKEIKKRIRHLIEFEVRTQSKRKLTEEIRSLIMLQVKTLSSGIDDSNLQKIVNGAVNTTVTTKNLQALFGIHSSKLSQEICDLYTRTETQLGTITEGLCNDSDLQQIVDGAKNIEITTQNLHDLFEIQSSELSKSIRTFYNKTQNQYTYTQSRARSDIKHIVNSIRSLKTEAGSFITLSQEEKDLIKSLSGFFSKEAPPIDINLIDNAQINQRALEIYNQGEKTPGLADIRQSLSTAEILSQYLADLGSTSPNPETKENLIKCFLHFTMAKSKDLNKAKLEREAITELNKVFGKVPSGQPFSLNRTDLVEAFDGLEPTDAASLYESLTALLDEGIEQAINDSDSKVTQYIHLQTERLKAYHTTRQKNTPNDNDFINTLSIALEYHRYPSTGAKSVVWNRLGTLNNAGSVISSPYTDFCEHIRSIIQAERTPEDPQASDPKQLGEALKKFMRDLIPCCDDTSQEAIEMDCIAIRFTGMISTYVASEGTPSLKPLMQQALNLHDTDPRLQSKGLISQFITEHEALKQLEEARKEDNFVHFKKPSIDSLVTSGQQVSATSALGSSRRILISVYHEYMTAQKPKAPRIYRGLFSHKNPETTHNEEPNAMNQYLTCIKAIEKNFCHILGIERATLIDSTSGTQVNRLHREQIKALLKDTANHIKIDCPHPTERRVATEILKQLDQIDQHGQSNEIKYLQLLQLLAHVLMRYDIKNKKQFNTFFDSRNKVSDDCLVTSIYKQLTEQLGICHLSKVPKRKKSFFSTVVNPEYRERANLFERLGNSLLAEGALKKTIDQLSQIAPVRRNDSQTGAAAERAVANSDSYGARHANHPGGKANCP